MAAAIASVSKPPDPPKTWSEFLGQGGFDRCVADVQEAIPEHLRELTCELTEALGLDSRKVRVNGSRIALQIGKKAGLLVEVHSALGSGVIQGLRTGKQACRILDNKEVFDRINGHACENCKVLRAVVAGRPAVAVVVSKDDMLVVSSFEL